MGVCFSKIPPTCWGPSESQHLKATNFQEALGLLCNKRAQDQNGNVDKDKALKEVEALTKKYKTEDAEWTAKRERMELRQWAMGLAASERWGENETAMVSKLFPDNVDFFPMKKTQIPAGFPVWLRRV
ncbi:unnamed protein product [Vitrella brassicaformis CCMP3155]|uniref:Uncharacterized protein n=1 Tax=Vitrella brassicaformis (strain CCMP3155) TaxID=1169540 RepID=A0A0G4GNN4_VITBC|nr:unnamed protein product [Vitrella brassicaformis CCMP3155]|mmetsp:Transcript_33013/g.81765  ORF Transcript_33013/g.81765 Transcript_33013/m.81765 type:complete len:128 (-) Transcript_33013:749-1132(-)|eukprot:CEM31711.1 unnamed protein product [Vitrella brassicaformis CCMP3155]